ncbi:MAG TPA: hypothetical protein VMA34_11240 [Terracidiphilus sp.]|nr:hypothetical protein [Terracidiphilus sp.]
MKPFVFVFRQSGPPPAGEQAQRRSEEVRAWALELRDQGHKLQPHILGEQSYFATANGNTHTAAGDTVTAVLIVDFSSLDEAKAAAEAHPGLRYGASVEVREAFPPAGAAQAQ